MEDPSHSFQDCSVIEGLLKEVYIPPIFKIRQYSDDTHLTDAADEVCRQLENKGLEELPRPGIRVCLTGSSRGIANMNVVLREAVSYLKRFGCHPFIVPAIGSHGRVTAEGQWLIPSSYGITEEFCGCPIDSSMETVELGHAEEEGKRLSVYIDKLIYETDDIVMTNRIKSHSASRGDYESGLTKILCIGLGNQEGADSLHRDGSEVLKTRIPLLGNFVRTHAKVLFGIGVTEDAHDQTCRVTVLRNEEIPVEEPGLLEYAKDLMPRILMDEIDVMVVKEIGKDLSGSGMDSNITGTWSTPYGGGGLEHQRTAVLDLTEASHENGVGTGQADTTTLRFYEKSNYLETYPNALISTVLWPIKLAMVPRDDKMAVQGVIKTCSHIDPEDPKIVLIRNILTMGELYLSKVYWEPAQSTLGIEIVEEPKEPSFDERGNLLIWGERQRKPS